MGNLTYQKIAKMANVAVSTVSKALSGSNEVSEDTAAKVYTVALNCGYFEEKRMQRRQLSPRNPLTVSLLVPEIDSTEYSRTVAIVYRRLENLGIDMKLHIVGFDLQKETEMLGKLQTDISVDGILSCSIHPITSPLAIPVVQMACKGQVDSVYSDVLGTMKKAVNFFKQQQYREIAFVGEEKTQAKQRAFLQAMKDAGFPAHAASVYTDEKRFQEAGRYAVRRMIQNGYIPDAIITPNDEIALGVMEELNYHDVAIPQRVAILGYNNTKYATLPEIGLSSVELFEEKQCEIAVNLLLERIRGTLKDPPQEIKIESNLVLRRTTRLNL